MNVNNTRWLPVPLLVGLGNAVVVGTLAGQEPARGDTLPGAELAPVVVEVLRTPVELRRAPLAVAAVSGPELHQGRTGIALDEAFIGIPGVQVDNRYNYALGERISIRGFGARTQFGVRGVRVVVDGVPATFADGQSALEGIDPATLERVEVVRGPASALYGNAAGGVILLRTQPPPLVPLRQEFRGVAGENGMRRYESRTAGHAGETSYELRVTHLGYDGYREHSAFQTRRLSGQLRRGLGGGELRLTGSVLEFDAQNPGSLSRAALHEDRLQAFPNNVAQGTGKDGRQGQLGAVFTAPLGAADIELSSHVQRREIVNPIPAVIIDLDRTSAGTRLLARGSAPFLATGSTWAVGTDLDAQWDDRQNHRNTGGERGELQLEQTERVLAVGAFAQFMTPILPTLSALGGIRADRFDFRFRNLRLPAQDPEHSGSRPMSAVSPSVGLIWNPTPMAALYGNFSTAFETPTTTELANRPDGAGGFNPELEPQNARSVELGLRGDLHGLRYDVAAYTTGIDNALIRFQSADGRDFFRNAGSARHRGLEAGAEIQLLPGLSGLASYSYTDAVFREYVVQGQDFAGNRIPGIAPHRVTGRITYRPADGWFVGLDGQRSSSMPVDDANTEDADSPAYTLVSLRGGLAPIRVGRGAVAPFIGVTNLLDEEYNTAVTVNAFGRRFYEPGPARALYLGVQLQAE
jgi:iron complex outermembrane recepter protein